MRRSSSWRVTMVGVLGLIGGCAHGGPPASAPRSSDDQFAMHVYGYSPKVVRLTPEGMTSATVNVGFYADEVRGLYEGRTIDLETMGRQVTGRARGWTNLTVSSKERAVAAMGEFDGRPAFLVLTPQQFRGSITGCDFQLQAKDGAYAGTNTCRDWPIDIHFPETLWSLPPGTQAVAIASFLAR